MSEYMERRRSEITLDNFLMNETIVDCPREALVRWLQRRPQLLRPGLPAPAVRWPKPPAGQQRCACAHWLCLGGAMTGVLAIVSGCAPQCAAHAMVPHTLYVAAVSPRGGVGIR